MFHVTSVPDTSSESRGSTVRVTIQCYGFYTVRVRFFLSLSQFYDPGHCTVLGQMTVPGLSSTLSVMNPLVTFIYSVMEHPSCVRPLSVVHPESESVYDVMCFIRPGSVFSSLCSGATTWFSM